MKQFTQQILPEGLPRTTVWGYGAVASESQRGLLVHNAPSLTIEAKWNRPVRVKWINDLRDPGGDFLPHLLPVDPTLHWANPPGGVSGRDSRPRFERRPDNTGPVPIVTHVHGAVGVADDSDGYLRPGICPRQGTSRRTTRPSAPGSISSRPRPGTATASPGNQAPPSSMPEQEPRLDDLVTTTRWA